MRTTVTIDDDLAVLLENRRRETGRSFKSVLNGALREGLVSEIPTQQSTREAFRTEPLDLGAPLLDDLDNSGEVLAYLDAADGCYST